MEPNPMMQAAAALFGVAALGDILMAGTATAALSGNGDAFEREN